MAKAGKIVVPVVIEVKTKLVSLRPTWPLLLQVLGFLALLVGISLWSVPSALIVGGILAIAAIEMQGKAPDLSQDREFKDLIDASVAAGKNPFADAKVPISQKWMNYAQLITRKL